MLEFSEGQMHFVALRKTYLKDYYYYYYYYYHYARKFIAFGSKEKKPEKNPENYITFCFWKPLKLHMHLANLETLLKGCLTPTNSEFFRPKCFQTELE